MSLKEVSGLQCGATLFLPCFSIRHAKKTLAVVCGYNRSAIAMIVDSPSYPALVCRGWLVEIAEDVVVDIV
jgi:hypothetical protein